MSVGRWRVEGFHEPLWLVRRSGLGEPGGPAASQALGADTAAFQVDVWFPDGWGDAAGAATLVEIAAALGEEILWSHDAEARRRLKALVRQALRDGRLVAVRAAPAAGDGGALEKEEEAPAAPAPRRDETTWIEIALSTDEDPPSPVPFKRYRVELPNGSVREGQLDARGMARLTGIDPGTCKVSFPEYDGKRWRRV